MWYTSDMANLDLNLLNPLDALRTEGNIANAVSRLQLSLYGMSRVRHTWPLGVAY